MMIESIISFLFLFILAVLYLHPNILHCVPVTLKIGIQPKFQAFSLTTRGSKWFLNHMKRKKGMFFNESSEHNLCLHVFLSLLFI